MKQAVETVKFGYPDVRFSHLVYYVVRNSADSRGPIELNEWVAYVAKARDLVLEEVYPQYNVNRERNETWREIGRTRWLSPSGEAYFHYRPAGIDYFGIHTVMDMKTDLHRDRLRSALPENPKIVDWLRVVEKNRFMELVEEQDEPRQAWWIGRNGKKKVLFTWQPQALWMYQMQVSAMHIEPPQPDQLRRERCEQLARDFGAVVELVQ